MVSGVGFQIHRVSLTIPKSAQGINEIWFGTKAVIIGAERIKSLCHKERSWGKGYRITSLLLGGNF